MNIKTTLIYCLALIFLISCGKPMANFTVTNPQNKAFHNVYFKNTSAGSSSYEWDFGDGTKSTDQSPTHQYFAAGSYNVTLKAIKGKNKSEKQMKLEVETPDHCTVEIETSLGKMTAILYDQTPLHRDNFLKLVGQGFYDSLLFHRVINNFMIQGGDPNSRGAKPGQQLGNGGPGYTVPAEFNPSLVHTKGALAAARMSDAVNPTKSSSGSQFYIVHGRPVDERTLNQMESSKGIHYSKEVKDKYARLGGTPFLDMEYTVFGEIISGFEVLDAIAATPTNPGDRPKEDVKMKIRVVSK